MENSKPPPVEILPGVWADRRRAVFFEPLRALVVADLHWGFSTAHRSAGNLLPVWGDAEIARTLEGLLRDFAPREMIWLGDCLHAFSGREPAERFLAETSQRGLTVTVLAGNHDRHWQKPCARDALRGSFYFHHGDQTAPTLAEGMTEVLGHFHPAAGLYDGAGARLRIPALVASPRRLILPAFSPWAAGAVWNDKLEPTEKLWAIAPSRIFEVRHPRRQPRTATK